MRSFEIKKLESIAFSVREQVIKLATDGGCFLGASLSCVDLLVYLYEHKVKFNFNNPDDPERDFLFLSKGHDVPALYSYFAEKGLLDRSRLKNHLKTTDSIYWHPNMSVPGVEFYSGSLGHLLSVGMGVAYDLKLKQGSSKVYVISGDGELNEGSMWEGILVAHALKLDNLVLVVDRNRFQANMQTEELIPLESLEKKFEAFGWNVYTADGHNFYDLDEIFSSIPESNDRPTAVIAESVRGKGLPSIESKADRWFCNFTENEIANLLEELKTGEKTDIYSETLVVR